MSPPTFQLKCLVADDEHYARELMAHLIGKVDFLQLVATCKNTLEIEKALKQQRIDLLFLDIQMPHKTGIAFLQEYRPEAKVIVTTAYPQYAVQGFELEALDYLVKPILEKRFMQAMEKVKKAFMLEDKAYSYDQLMGEQEQSITIKSGYDLHKIKLSDIEYIESVGEYIRYHTRTQRYLVLNSLSKMEKELPDDFIRTHRSYIIPLLKITGKVGHSLILSSGKEIPIGKTYRSKINKMNLLKGR